MKNDEQKSYGALITMLDGSTILFDDYDKLVQAIQEADKNGCPHLFTENFMLTVRQIAYIKRTYSFVELVPTKTFQRWERKAIKKRDC